VRTLPNIILKNRAALSETSTESLPRLNLDTTISYLDDPEIQVRLEVRDGNVVKYCKLPNRSSVGDWVELCAKTANADIINGIYAEINDRADSFNKRTTPNLMLLVVELGRKIFELIFDPEERATICKIAQVNKEFSASGSYKTSAAVPRILVECRGVNIPWELMFLGDVPAPEDIVALPRDDLSWFEQQSHFNFEDFLGHNFFITQRNSRGSGERGVQIAFDPDAGIRVYADAKLPATVAVEAPMVEQVARSHGMLSIVADHKPSNGLMLKKGEKGGVDFSTDMNTNPAALYHFACHAEIRDLGKILRISDNYFVTTYEIRERVKELPHAPFAIFNSCSLGLKVVGEFDDFMASLFAKGFKGVVATEIAVGNDVAIEFVRKIYEFWFGSINGSLHSAIFWARRHVVDTFGLVGFCYSFYGHDDLIYEGEQS